MKPIVPLTPEIGENDKRRIYEVIVGIQSYGTFQHGVSSARK